MQSRWPNVKLEKVLTERKEKPDFAAILNGEVPIVAKIGFDTGKIELREESKTKTNMILIKTGDLVISGINAAKGAIAIYDEKNTTPAAATIHYSSYAINNEKADPVYLWYFMRSDIFRSILMANLPGGIKTEVKPRRLLPIEVSLPPLEEQGLIVKRIESLLARIDETKNLLQEISDHELLRLRDVIFRKAFQGKITSQDPNDEPASALIQRIRAEKTGLITEKRIKKEKPLSPILLNEKPYELPQGWEWVQLGEICALITDGTHQTPRYVEEGMMFLSAQNVKPYKFMPENYRCVSFEDYLSYVAHAKPEKGDILMTRVGAGIGETTIIDQELDFAFYVSLCLIKPFKEYVHVPYLLHWLNSPHGAASSKQHTYGRGHSQANLNLNLIKRFVLPLPPLNEQRRIAAYLNSFQAMVDELKKLHRETEKEIEELIPSILDKAFKGEL